MNTILVTIAAIALTTAVLSALLIWRSVRRPGWVRRVRSWVGVGTGGVLLALSLLTLVGVYLDTLPSAPRGLPTAEQRAAPVPPVEYRLVADESPASLEAHRGDVVLLNLWATWCAPCLQEMPVLERLQAELGDRGLVVVTLSNDPLDKIEGFRARLPEGTVNAFADEDDLPDPFSRAFRTLPTTYLIDREGYFQDAFVGTRSYEGFVEKVEPLL